MKIDWNMSPKLIEKARRIDLLHQGGLPYRKIASELGNHFTYIIAVHHQWLKSQGKGGEKTNPSNQ